MSGRFEGESVIVTGAARGLGRGIAAAFAREGANVLICDVNEERLATTAEALRDSSDGSLEAVYADVAVAADVQSLMERALELNGAVDHLVNNAGIVTIAPFPETTEPRPPTQAWTATP